MPSFNYIPDHLREDEPSDWSPAQGRRRGASYTALASVMIAGVAATLGYAAPFLTQRIILNFAWGFLITFTLFAVMHRAANIIDPWCTLMAILFAFPPLAANHIGFVMNLAASSETSFAQVWASRGLAYMALSNFPALIAVGIAAALCKNEDFSLLDLANLLMTNPLTGRRV